MARIREILRPWTQQPQVRVGVNSASPHADGLFALAHAALMYDAVQGRPLDGSTGRSKLATTRGVALSSTSNGDWCFGPIAGIPYGSRDAYSYNLTAGAVSGNYSTLIIWTKPAGTADAIYNIGRTSNGAALSWAVQFLSGNTYPEFRVDAKSISYSSAVPVADGDIVAFLYSYELSVGASVYVRNLTTGRLDTISLSNTDVPHEGYGIDSYNAQIIGAGGSGSIDTYGLPVIMDARWRRLTSAKQAFDLLGNPWQLFEPQSIVVPVLRSEPRPPAGKRTRVIQRPWTQQPSVGTMLRSGNGLHCAIAPRLSNYDLVNRRVAMSGNGENGFLADFSAAGPGGEAAGLITGYGFGISAEYVNANFIFGSIGFFLAQGSASGYLYLDYAGSLGAGSLAVQVGSSGQLTAIAPDNSFGSVSIVLSSADNRGRLVWIAMQASYVGGTNTLEASLDGGPVVSLSEAGDGKPYGTGIVVNPGSGFDGFTGGLYFAGFGFLQNSLLPKDALREMARPWSLFEPQRIVVPAPALPLPTPAQGTRIREILRPWTQQPQHAEARAIDGLLWLEGTAENNRLDSVVASTRNLVNGALRTENFPYGGPAAKGELTNHGVAYQSSIPGDTYARAAAYDGFKLAGLPGITFLLWFQFRSTVPYNNTSYIFTISYGSYLATYSSTSSSINWGSDYAGGWTGDYQQVLSGLTDGQFVCLAASIGPGGARYFANGQFSGTKPYGLGTIPDTAMVDGPLSFPRYGQAAFGRALSDDELAAYTANPWLFFEPQRIIVPLNYGLPRLSDATATDITSTGFRPRVTAR